MPESDFLKLTERHLMLPVMDNRHHRHLRFQRQDSLDAHFDIVTWPGRLCISGDRGCYVFGGQLDMMSVFRAPDRDTIPAGVTLPVKLDEWQAMLVSEDTVRGTETFDPEMFAAEVHGFLDEAGATDAVRAAAVADVISEASMGEISAMTAVEGFNKDGFQFPDASEFDCHSYSRGFLFCCYAIVWAIGFYDEMVAANAATTAPALPESIPQ